MPKTNSGAIHKMLCSSFWLLRHAHVTKEVFSSAFDYGLDINNSASVFIITEYLKASSLFTELIQCLLLKN